MKHLIVLFVAAVIFSCSSSTTIPTQAVETKSSSTPEEVELLEGKKLYEANCGTCHKLHKPNSQSAEGWKHEVPEMSIKVNKKAGMEVLDAKKQEIILNYLLTASNQK